MKKLLFSLAIVAAIVSCGKDKTNEELFNDNLATIKADNAAQLVKDDTIIKQYIKDKKLTANPAAEGVYYVIETPGTGASPSLTNTVRVNYKGYRTDGTVFDQSQNPINFALLNLIPGWYLGLQKFKKGDKGKIIIPSPYGYGARGSGLIIPPNTVLVFDIDLLDVL